MPLPSSLTRSQASKLSTAQLISAHQWKRPLAMAAQHKQIYEGIFYGEMTPSRISANYPSVKEEFDSEIEKEPCMENNAVRMVFCPCKDGRHILRPSKRRNKRRWLRE